MQLLFNWETSEDYLKDNSNVKGVTLKVDLVLPSGTKLEAWRTLISTSTYADSTLEEIQKDSMKNLIGELAEAGFPIMNIKGFICEDKGIAIRMPEEQ